MEGCIPLPTSSDEYLSVDELTSLFVLKSRAKVARDGAVRCCWDISISDIALPNSHTHTYIGSMASLFLAYWVSRSPSMFVLHPRRRTSRASGFHCRLFVCLFYRTMSQKPMQLGSPNLTYKCSTISTGNPFICGLRPMQHLLCDFIARFFHATLSRDKVAARNCACRTLRLVAFINKHWPISLVSACLCDKVAVCDMHSFILQTLSRDRCATKSQVWHRSSGRR